MSELDVEALLKPLSEDSPCGGDLEYAPEFLALMESRGVEATVIGRFTDNPRAVSSRRVLSDLGLTPVSAAAVLPDEARAQAARLMEAA